MKQCRNSETQTDLIGPQLGRQQPQQALLPQTENLADRGCYTVTWLLEVCYMDTRGVLHDNLWGVT